ncbi:hypothetical protein D3C84_979230 [compost metagenome]
MDENIPEYIKASRLLGQHGVHLFIYLYQLNTALEHAINNALDVRPNILGLEVFHHIAQKGFAERNSLGGCVGHSGIPVWRKSA